MADTNFLGRNGFYHFTGVVEDRNDPLYNGRLRVRCIGIHTDDKAILPTVDLPWASVIMPVTSSGISGLGQSPSFLVEGTWCFGYFRDGESMQEPVIMGSLPGNPFELSNPSKGFYDPNGVYPKYKNETDVNRLAVNGQSEHLSLTLRKLARTTGIATADFNLRRLQLTAVVMVASDSDTWDQPTIPYLATSILLTTFLRQRVAIYESMMTPQAHERIYEAHKSGTSYEIDSQGNKVDIIKGNHYTIVSSNSQAQIRGNSDVTLDGRHKVYINKSGIKDNHYDIQVGPNASVNIQVDSGDINLVTVEGKINVNAGGDYNVKVGGNYTVSVAGNTLETTEGTRVENTTKASIIRGQTIDLNP